MKRDGRTFDHKTLEALRRMAVERVREGEKPSVVMSSYGFCRTTIYKWLRQACGRGRGMRALRARKASGRPRRLSAAQEWQVFRWVNGKDPRQYGLDLGLWTRRIVATLIEERFSIRLGLTAVGKLLGRVGLTPQKPLRRAYERDPAAIEWWQRESYPNIAKRAKAVGANIYFWDESGFRTDALRGRTWSVKGETPVVSAPGKRQSISAASAVNARGGFWFCTFSGAMNAGLFLALLKRFMKHRRKPLFLVLDSLPTHKAKSVADYVSSTAGKLELHFLPGYAPELNPDELVWNYVKQNGTSKCPLIPGESLRERVESDLFQIKYRPALIRSFFTAPSVAYISD